MYVVFEGEIGVKVSCQVLDFCCSFDYFPYDIYCGVGGLVELLPAPKINEFSFCFIQFEFTASIQALISCMDFFMMAMVLFSCGVLLTLLVLIVSSLKVLFIE